MFRICTRSNRDPRSLYETTLLGSTKHASRSLISMKVLQLRPSNREFPLMDLSSTPSLKLRIQLSKWFEEQHRNIFARKTPRILDSIMMISLSPLKMTIASKRKGLMKDHLSFEVGSNKDKDKRKLFLLYNEFTALKKPPHEVFFTVWNQGIIPSDHPLRPSTRRNESKDFCRYHNARGRDMSDR